MPTTPSTSTTPITPQLVQLTPNLDNKPDIGPESSPIELVEWASKRFLSKKVVLTTSFGMEGCVLIDIWSKQLEKLAPHQRQHITIAYIDTGFFFPETHELKNRIVERYPNVNIQAWTSSVTLEQQKKTYGDSLWESNPNLCCHLRKVLPMADNIAGHDLWVTGVRRTQTELRKSIDVLSWDWRYNILKFCPFANWTRSNTWEYVQKHQVPFNELHLNGFPSIGCYHCTRAVPGSSPDTDSRAGRWEGNEKTECGLHYSI